MRTRTLKVTLLAGVQILVGGLLPLGTARAETWYWCGTGTGTYADVTAESWTNAVGAHGVPTTGDSLMLGNSNGSAKPGIKAYPSGTFESVTFRAGYNPTYSNGEIDLQTGGAGLRYLYRGSFANFYGIVKFYGNGEALIHAEDAKSVLTSQQYIKANSGDTPIVVKTGSGRFNFGNTEGGVTYAITQTIIREGSLFINKKGTKTGQVFTFDCTEDGVWLGSGAGTKCTTRPNFIIRSGALRETARAMAFEHGLTSEMGHRFVLDGTPLDAEMVFTGKVSGDACFAWAPAGADYAFTFSNAVSDTTGELAVSNGTVKLRGGAMFTKLGETYISSRGCLDLGRGSQIVTESLTVGDKVYAAGIYGADGVSIVGEGVVCVGGAEIPESIAVPFDGTDVTTRDLTEDSFFSNPALVPLFGPYKVVLAQAIPLQKRSSSEDPFIEPETNRLAVARFSATVGVRVSDFVDGSAKTCALPTTWFETETVDDVTTLYLVARPVITALAYKGKDTYCFMSEDDKAMWSDGATPHGGADYYCDIATKNTSCQVFDWPKNTVTEYDFPGETLTFCDCMFHTQESRIGVDMRAYDMNDGNDANFWAIPRTSVVQGKIRIGEGNGLQMRSNANSLSHALKVESEISGPGKLYLQTYSTTTKTNCFAFCGDNSGLSGQFQVYGTFSTYNNANTWNQFYIAITNANALGGAMETPTANGLLFQGFPMLRVLDTTTFATPNRGVASDCGLRLEVAEGKTFTLMNPYLCYMSTDKLLVTNLAFRVGLEKSGRGTFALGARYTPANKSYAASSSDGTNNLVRVLEGGIEPLTEDCFADCQLDFRAGSSIVVDPKNEMTAAVGLKVVRYAPMIAEGAKVSLVADIMPTDTEEFSVTFLTVSQSAPDLSRKLAPRRVRTADGCSMRGVVEKSDTTVDGIACTVYSVHYSPCGFCLIIR